MEKDEIAPAPVNTMDELLSKIDMIHAAAVQWVDSDDACDPELGQALRVRVHELVDDVVNVGVTEEQWNMLSTKFNAINEVLRTKLDTNRGKLIKALNESYERS